MIEKCNKIYSIFNEDIIVSKNLKINAIEGYDVIDMANVGDIKDIEKWFEDFNHNINVPSNQLFRFTNPATGVEWYIGSYLIARKGGGDWCTKPVIKAFYYNNTALVDSIDILFTYIYFINKKNCTNIKIVGSLGKLSTPHASTTNYKYADLTKIRLPLSV